MNSLNIGERIKKLRKSLDMTQQKFAERIGVKRNTIGQYEIGRNEPIDAIINLICREFNVNKEWLQTGIGEMFKPVLNSELDILVAKYKLTSKDYIFLQKFLENPKVRNAIEDFCIEFASAISHEKE